MHQLRMSKSRKNGLATTTKSKEMGEHGEETKFGVPSSRVHTWKREKEMRGHLDNASIQFLGHSVRRDTPLDLDDTVKQFL